MKKFFLSLVLLLSLTPLFAETNFSLSSTVCFLNGVCLKPSVEFGNFEINLQAGLNYNLFDSTTDKTFVPTFGGGFGYTSNPCEKGQIYAFGLEFLYLNNNVIGNILVDVYYNVGYNFTENFGFKGNIRIPIFMDLKSDSTDLAMLEYVGKYFLYIIEGIGVEFVYIF